MPAIVSDDDNAPTPQLALRHQITRHGSAFRKLSRLERLVESGEISPQAGDSGRRYGSDYEIAFGGGFGSSWKLGQPPSQIRGGFDLGQVVVDATARVRAVAVFLNKTAQAPSPGCRPAQILQLAIVQDLPWSDVARQVGSPDVKKVKRLTLGYLDALATHYAAVDAERGRDDLAHTQAVALARFAPELPEAA
jgi:hypothetical protein